MPHTEKMFAIAIALAAAHAQQPAERSTELIHVPFAAVASDGQLIPDLTAEDVAIKIDGRARAVRTLQFVSLAGTVRSRDTAELVVLPAPFGSNSVTNAGRAVLLVIDEDSVRPGEGQQLRQAIDRFATALAPDDRVSLVTTPYGGEKVPFTTDRGRLRAALAFLAGRATRETGSDAACRTRDTLQALTRHFKALGLRTAPTAVVIVTGGLSAPRRDAPVTMAPGMCELSLDAFRETAAAAGALRAQLYVVPPGEVVGAAAIGRENIAGGNFRGSENPMEGIEQLLGVTGGTFVNLGGADDSAFDRILRESAAYYVAALTPERADRDGRSHQLEVKVLRRGVDARAGRTIAFGSRAAAGAAPAPSPRDMLSTLAEFRDLPLRAAAFPSLEEAGGQLKVLAIAEPADPAVKLSALSAALFDRDGKAAAGWVARAEDLDRAPIVGAVTAPPGAYRLRVAAIDTTGRSGTVDYSVAVDLARSGPLTISALLLGLSRGGFAPRLQFGTEPVVIGYVEMTGAPPGAAVTATLDLADSENGPARVSVPLTIDAGAPGRYVARGALPIGALPPGDYVARATIGLEGHPPTRVLRTLRKVKS